MAAELAALITGVAAVPTGGSGGAITDVTEVGSADVDDVVAGVANTESTVVLTTTILAGSFL